MMKIKVILLIALGIISQSCSIDKLYQMKQNRKSYGFEQVDFDDIAKLYMGKGKVNEGNIEGIYSVSSIIVKKGKGFLSSTEKEKVMDRRENYSKVAIFKDRDKSDREYFEVPIDKEKMPSYSIRGEFNKVSEGNILVYKHFEHRGKVLTYTFTYDSEKDILEGIRTEVDGAFTVTYKLTYLRLFPKKLETVSN
ncbi:MAG: hypothetical protein ACKVOQ_00900 [Cyclobacteriaceae bacterium]